MEILRVPPYPLTTTWTVSEANAAYTVVVEDLVDHSIETSELVSDDSSKISYVLTATQVKFDREFSLKVYDAESEIVVDDILSVYRPYVDPKTVGTTASEIQEYKNFEIVARAIIDDYTNHGFYNHKLILQGEGTGTDYYPVWENINKVLQVYENDALVYDSYAADPTTNVYEYKVTLDKTAIYRLYPSPVNGAGSAPIRLPSSSGDLWSGNASGSSFKKNCDYTFVLDAGEKTVPTDVEVATKMLVDDMQCGKLDYYKRYVTGYNTDQFKIQFDKQLFDGTGNIVVDKMLKKYIRPINRLGAL